MNLMRRKRERNMTKRIIVILLMTLSVVAYAQDTISLPAWFYTTTQLNLRQGPGTSYAKVTSAEKNARLKVLSFADNGWAEVAYLGGSVYCSPKYIEYDCPVETEVEPVHSGSSKGLLSTLFGWAWDLLLLSLVVALVRKLLIWGAGLISVVGYKVYWFISLPFYFLNWLQRYASKPWRLMYKWNSGNDARNRQLREVYEWVKIPIYIVLTPLRLVNAVYYNLVVHCFFEAMNYMLEVLIPSHDREGADDFWRWVLFLPWRILKYPVWHGTLTYVESVIWTVIDTFIPALTLYHGTSPEASECITQSRGRVGNNSWRTEVWSVGAGNFAGNGIYFAPERSTAMHYSCGSLIVCRVSLGRVIDLGLAPYKVYKECGHANAFGATRYGLQNGYTTGEWWRGDCRWWEYCMYDWKNRYNHSWRIRPIFVLSNDDEMLQRIPGGMHHWLFRRMVIGDIWYSLSSFFK